jgi:hypothetical protein
MRLTLIVPQLLEDADADDRAERAGEVLLVLRERCRRRADVKDALEDEEVGDLRVAQFQLLDLLVGRVPRDVAVDRGEHPDERDEEAVPCGDARAVHRHLDLDLRLGL